MKKKKIHSLRFEISAVFIGIMVGTFLMCLVVNLFFMERFYIQNKREAIIAAYRSISQAIGSGDITSEEFDNEIYHICERYNIEMIVLDADSKTLKTSSNNAELLAKVLWDNMISSATGTNSSMSERTIIDYGDDYTLQITVDKGTGRQYLEMW